MAYVKRVCSLVVGVTCVAVAGCSPSPVASPSPSPSPSAAFLCVPEAGGDPVVCGPIEFEQAQRRDALYAEAEAAYRRYWAEVQRVELSAHPVVTPELEVVTEPRFRELLREAFVQAEGRQRVEGEGSVVWVRHAPGVSR